MVTRFKYMGHSGGFKAKGLVGHRSRGPPEGSTQASAKREDRGACIVPPSSSLPCQPIPVPPYSFPYTLPFLPTANPFLSFPSLLSP